MSEATYGLNSLLIAVLLFASMAACLELGHRIGRRPTAAGETVRTHVNAIQASMLGVLALLLGFTFSMALQRFDTRSDAEVDEANAIGTAYLRAQLLPEPVRDDARRLLRDYLDLRVREARVSLADERTRQELLAGGARTLDSLWGVARRAALIDTSPRTTGLFVQALNQAIDAYGRRDALLGRHVPEAILLILYGTFLLTAGVVGYAAGIAGHRPALVSYILVALIVVVTFVIIDLDRPRRGLIRIDQSSLVNLAAAIAAAAAAAGAAPAGTAPPGTAPVGTAPGAVTGEAPPR